MKNKHWADTVESILLLNVLVFGIALIWHLFDALNLLTEMHETAYTTLSFLFKISQIMLIMLFLRAFGGWVHSEGKLPSFLREGDNRPFDTVGVISYVTAVLIPLVWFLIIPHLESMNKRTPGIRDSEQDFATIIVSWILILGLVIFYANRRTKQTNAQASSLMSTLLIGLIPTGGGVYLMISTWMDFYSGMEILWYLLIGAAPLIFLGSVLPYYSKLKKSIQGN